jgi:hypothetical protein
MQQYIYGINDRDLHEEGIKTQRPSAVPEYLFWYSLRAWHFTFIEVQLLENPELLQPEIEVVLFNPEQQAIFQKSIQYFADFYGHESFEIDRNLEGRRIMIHVPVYRPGQLGDVLSEAQVKMLETEMWAGNRLWIFTIFALREGINVEWQEDHHKMLFHFIDWWIYFGDIISTKELEGINPFFLLSEEQIRKTDENQPLNLSLYEPSNNADVRILKWDKKEAGTPEYFYVNNFRAGETIYLILNYIHKNSFEGAGVEELKLHTKAYFLQAP